MHKRNTRATSSQLKTWAIIFIALILHSSAFAEPWFCARDIDGDGSIDSENETLS